MQGVRFGERIGRNHSEKSLYGALDPTSREVDPYDTYKDFTGHLINSGDIQDQLIKWKIKMEKERSVTRPTNRTVRKSNKYISP